MGSRRRALSAIVTVLGVVAACSSTTSRTTPPSGTSTAPAEFDPATYAWSRAGFDVPGSVNLTHSVILDHPDDVLRSLKTAEDAPVVVMNALDSGVADSTLNSPVQARSTTAPARARIDQTSIDGHDKTAVGGSAVWVTHSRLTSKVDGVNPTGTAPDNPRSVLEYNLIQGDNTRTEGAHSDGIQLWQGGNILIMRNRITDWSNSAILLKSDYGPISQVTISDNYLAAPVADYSLYLAQGNYGTPSGVTVTDNVFGPCRLRSTDGCTFPVAGMVFVKTVAERDAAVAAHVSGADKWVVWSGNTDARTGREIVPPGGWRSYP